MKIGVDLDEVLADFVSPLLEYHNEKYKTNLTEEKVHSYYFWEVWGGTRKEAIEKIQDFLTTDYFKNIQPILGSQEGIEILSKKHELILITSRPISIRNETLTWLNKYFPNKFSEEKIYFTAKAHLQKNIKAKANICLEQGIELLIEDNLDYAKESVLNGTRVLLFDYPWNQADDLPERIKRVYSWQDILENIK